MQPPRLATPKHQTLQSTLGVNAYQHQVPTRLSFLLSKLASHAACLPCIIVTGWRSMELLGAWLLMWKAGWKTHLSTHWWSDFCQGKDCGWDSPHTVTGNEGRSNQRSRNQGVCRGEPLPEGKDDGSDGHVQTEVSPAETVKANLAKTLILCMHCSQLRQGTGTQEHDC